jgi:hypothetical protein
MSQALEVLQLLKKKPKGVTSMDAFKLGITRLAARIFELRRQGHVIETYTERTKNANYARYFLDV